MPAVVAHPVELTPADVAQISPLYNAFVAELGEHDAAIILHCGGHRKDRARLTDYLTDCVIVAISYECFTTFHANHGFANPTNVLRSWINTNVDFSAYTAAELPGDMMDAYKKTFKAFLSESTQGG